MSMNTKDRPMNKTLIRLAPVVVIAWQMFGGVALAQQPTAAAVATAKELVELKGGGQMFDPVVAGVVEQTKGALLQTNPQLSKDLNEVSAQLRTEFGPKRDELVTEAAKRYAQRFSDQELKDLVAFFKTPLGKKMLTLEPQVLDDTFNFVQQWAPRLGEDVMTRFRAEMKKKGHTI
jgi:hypothetical protein